MKVFLTGSTGFVGLNIVSHLVAEGHQIVAFVRTSSNTSFLERFPVQVVRGSLDDRTALESAMVDCDAVIHCAGMTSCYAFDYPALYQTNVASTRALIEAALACGITRLVYTSTTSTVGSHGKPRARANESLPLNGFRAQNPYGKTKLEAERLLIEAVPRGLEPIILNPAEVLGAWDHTMNWGQMVLGVLSDRVPFLPPGSASFCSADEVGRAHVTALTRGEPGSRYILAGTDTLLAGFVDEIARVAGCSYTPPSHSYEEAYYQSYQLAHGYAYGGELPLLDPYRMRVFKGHHLFDSSRASDVLGYRTTPLGEMIQSALTWYQENGFLSAPKESRAS